MQKPSTHQVRPFAKVLMAGEDVLLLGKPDLKTLVIYDIAAAVLSFVVLLVLINMFAGAVGAHEKTNFTIMFAIITVAIVHLSLATRTYALTDKRILVIGLTKEISDSCELQEIESVTAPKMGGLIMVKRRNGNPLPLLAVPDPVGFENALQELMSSESSQAS